MIATEEKTSTETKAVESYQRPSIVPVLRKLIDFFERTPEANERVSLISVERSHAQTEGAVTAKVYIGGLETMRRMFPGCRATVVHRDEWDTYSLGDTSITFVAVESKANESMPIKNEEVTL